MWLHHLHHILTTFILLHTYNNQNSGFVSGDVKLVCPEPVVDAIGTTYKTVDRFNKIREDNNELKTKSKDGNYYYYFKGRKFRGYKLSRG